MNARKIETISAWELKIWDHIVLDGRHYFVLSKNLIPLGSEVGFCVNFQEEGRREPSWQFFRWNEKIYRIH